MNIMAGSLNGNFPKLSTNKLEVISVVVNNKCNLNCRHCYLQPPKFDNYLTREEWNLFFNSVFLSIKPTVLCFSGKEIFIGEESVNILLDTIKLRNQSKLFEAVNTEIGVLTNGTLIHNYKHHLIENPPDYFDVSIDGMPDVHDYIRGVGAFDKLRPNLEWLVNNFPDNVWLTPTINVKNLDSISEFVKYYNEHFNLKRFSIGFYKDTNLTDRKIKLTDLHYKLFIKQTIPGLKQLNLKDKIEIIFDLDYHHSDLIEMLVAMQYINLNSPISSTEHSFENGVTIRFNVSSIPVGFWRSIRVTPEGYWIAAEDLLRVGEYDKLAAATLRDYNYNAKSLYHAGMNSNRFMELMNGKKIFIPE